MVKRLTVISVLLILGATAWGGSVRLKPQAHVAGQVVRLSDVAEIGDVRGVDATLLEKLTVAAAPEPGRSMHLTRSQIQKRMVSGGINMSQILLEGASRVEVTGGASAAEDEAPAAQEDSGRLADCIQDYVSKRMQAEGFRVRVRLVNSEVPESSLPATAGLRVSSVRGKLQAGTVDFAIVSSVAGRESKRFKARASVEWVGQVVVASRELRAGMRIEPGMVKLEQACPTDDPSSLLTDVSEVVGRRLVARVATGESLSGSDLDSRIVVKSGDTVVVTLRGRGYRIEMKAEARRSGAAGDRVELINPTNRKRFQAVVVGRGRAELIYGKD